MAVFFKFEQSEVPVVLYQDIMPHAVLSSVVAELSVPTQELPWIVSCAYTTESLQLLPSTVGMHGLVSLVTAFSLQVHHREVHSDSSVSKLYPGTTVYYAFSSFEWLSGPSDVP